MADDVLPDPPISFESDIAPLTDECTEAEAVIYIKSAWARAITLAPCLGDPAKFSNLKPEQLEAVKEVLRDVVIRRAERGSGVVSQEGAADYTRSLRDIGASIFRPSEIRDLQSICSDVKRRPRASTIPTGFMGSCSHHASWCAVNFNGALDGNPTGAPRWCDCGADLTSDGSPLWVRG